MYKPIDIANYFLAKHQDDPTMTPMKLIKLVYICHGCFLAVNDAPLIDENAEAWKFGPVIPSLYNKFKNYRNEKIAELGENKVPELEVFLDSVWDIYGKYDGVQLSSKTHQPKTPWSVTWEKAIEKPFTYSLAIPNELIKSHYKKIVSGVN